MTFLKNLRSFALLAFIFTFLTFAACESKSNADDSDNTENVKTDSVEKADHPKGEAEHPTNKSDSTTVQ